MCVDGVCVDERADSGSTDAAMSDPCADVTCPSGQACRPLGGTGVCRADCAQVTCLENERCDETSGVARCIADCSNLDCGSGRTCTTQSGVAECIVACTDPACTSGQRCETVDGAPACVDNTCADIECESTEVCDEATDGTGFVCRDNTCESDINCGEGENCSPEGLCIGDVCEPGRLSCNGNVLEECLANGSGEFTRATCLGSCTDDGNGVAFCPCADDWDCPAFTECVVDRCVGTGRAPTCRVSTAPLSAVLPAPEEGFPWGGADESNDRAVGSPFPDYAQVVLTPAVANLDDDNGDGLINELDFPELIFLSFCNSSYRDDGVLRAVHGGGPSKGEDFFATCASNVWSEGMDPGALDSMCPCGSTPDLDSTAGVAVGDLNGDGVPEIVAITEITDGNHSRGRARIFSNRGQPLVTSAAFTFGADNPSPAIVNLDGTGMAEIVVGRSAWTLREGAGGSIEFDRRFEGNFDHGSNGQGPISCAADLNGDGRQEVIAGGTAYRFPMPAEPEFAAGDLVALWNGPNGFCAIADVWGADSDARPGPANPLDGVPEVVVVSSGRVRVLRSTDGFQIHDVDLPGNNGGAPNIDDFDGDGFPEVGTAGEEAYVVFDFQEPTTACPAWTNAMSDIEALGELDLQGNPARTPPGLTCLTDADCQAAGSSFTCNEATQRCICLHNGWQRQTQDESSRVTGSSVFDFNGDGAAEVIYNDECFFRVYDGLDGRVYFKELSESRTRTEYPVVADVDNDGNAEIVFGVSNESRFCTNRWNGTTPGPIPDRDVFNNGLEVWGDGNDLWVSARRIWNQHAYHVTNVYEGGGIPPVEPDSWASYPGRAYNSYRSNPPSLGGIAPDLVVAAVQVASPGVACGTLSEEIDVSALIRNEGDLRVGPGVRVTFYGTWDTEGFMGPLLDGSGQPLEAALTTSMEPGGEVRVSVRYDASGKTPSGLPDSVLVRVDEDDRERECVPDPGVDNNQASAPVEPGATTADLVMSIQSVSGECPTKSVEIRVDNLGSQAADDVAVRLFAGDPAAGGIPLATVTMSGSIAAGSSATETFSLSNLPTREIRLFGVVDPDNAIAECNDGNNGDEADDPIDCGGILL